MDKIVAPVMQPLYNYVGRNIGDDIFQKKGVDAVAEILSEFQDVYAYKFGWNDLPEPMDFLVGDSHMMEIPFFLGNFQQDCDSLFRFAWNSDNEYDVQTLSHKIVTYLSQFVREGNPNVEGLPYWKEWDKMDNRKRLYLDNIVHMIE